MSLSILLPLDTKEERRSLRESHQAKVWRWADFQDVFYWSPWWSSQVVSIPDFPHGFPTILSEFYQSLRIRHLRYIKTLCLVTCIWLSKNKELAMIHQRNKQKGCPKCLSDPLWNIIESYNQCLSSSKTFFSREFENVAVSWDNASAVPAWLKGTYFKNGPARFSLWMKNSTTFFLFQARFWRKLEVRQHGGWLGKDLQVQRRCKWGEF